MLLAGEARPLNLGIIQLSVGVGNLHARGESLEPFDVAIFVGVVLGQR